MKCPECGIEIDDNELFCTACGAEIITAIPNIESDNKKKAVKKTSLFKNKGTSTNEKPAEDKKKKI
ncbi:MAG: zinc ribbon domain-containing protein, partial [Oscillospiraceae bacterium]|nr:zinc ribbon domain-containing protein [Oscillospiraceae bacterium]